jgi:putative transposase
MRVNAHGFLSLADARERPEDWPGHDNEDRPPSAIDYNDPIAIRDSDDATSP